MKYKDDTPKVPLIALKVRITDSHRVNKMLQVLQAKKFIINMFPSVANDKEIYFVLLSMGKTAIEKNAELQKFLIKLADDSSLEQYKVAKRT